MTQDPERTGADAPSMKMPSTNRSPRRRAREFVVQGLYEWRVGGQDEAATEAHIAQLEGIRRADGALLDTLLRGVRAHSAELTELLAPYLDRNIDEMSPIEACILLLGAYEFAYHPETPYRVVINEAIELAKTFGGIDGHKYVNGVLDKLALQLREAEVAGAQAGCKPSQPRQSS